MNTLKPEQQTRLNIDKQLRQVGWEADTEHLRYSLGVRPEKGRNIAIAEYPCKSGFIDYALFIDTQFIATIEVKKDDKPIYSELDYQGKRYPSDIRDEDKQYLTGKWEKYQVPFSFTANGKPYNPQDKTLSGIYFLDLRQPENIPQALRCWLSPQQLLQKLQHNTQIANQKLQQKPYDFLQDKDGLNLRDYQIQAVKSVEKAVINGQREMLIAMATGTGKTRTVLAMIYRFLSSNRFHRILFLVDRTVLGQQAIETFNQVKIEDLKSLGKIYNINGLEESTLSPETRLQVATVQSMIKRIIHNDTAETQPNPYDYDLIIIDEAHRGYILDKDISEDEKLYIKEEDYQSKYAQVINYFDAVKIALTATPALHTVKIFGKPVFDYSYRQAVIDGYLVDYEIATIKTKFNTHGIHFNCGEKVDIIDTATGETQITELPDELNFDPKEINKHIIASDFERTVLGEIAQHIDPNKPQKTLIYAIDNKHADRIVHTLREIYQLRHIHQDAIVKITAQVGSREEVLQKIRQFKNEQYPNIVVTVELLTTGFDCPAISSLIFMRYVNSRILYEQMIGRATRRCDNLEKTHFTIYDPIGITQNIPTGMKPVVVQPTITLKQLIEYLKQATEERSIKKMIEQIIVRMRRKIKQMNISENNQFADLAYGKTPDEVIKHIQHNFNKSSVLDYENAICFLDTIKNKDTVIYTDKPDTLIGIQWSKNTTPQDYIQSFIQYLQENKDEIVALNIVCTRPKDLTRQSLIELSRKLAQKDFTTKKLCEAYTQLTNQAITADIITLIRHYALGAELIDKRNKIKRAMERLKQAYSFNATELKWLSKIEDYLLTEDNSLFNNETFDQVEQFKGDGKFKRFNQLFNNRLTQIVQAFNDYLYDDGGQAA